LADLKPDPLPEDSDEKIHPQNTDCQNNDKIIAK